MNFYSSMHASKRTLILAVLSGMDACLTLLGMRTLTLAVLTRLDACISLLIQGFCGVLHSGFGVQVDTPLQVMVLGVVFLQQRF